MSLFFALSDSLPPRSPSSCLFFLMLPRPPTSTLFPYTTLFRSSSSRGRSRLSSTTSCRRKNCQGGWRCSRSEEHTSELQSHSDLVCRLLLEKKKKPVGTDWNDACSGLHARERDSCLKLM